VAASVESPRTGILAISRKLAIPAIGLLAVALSLGPSVATASTTYDAGVDASANKTVLFVGDSNFLYGASSLTTALANRPHGYIPVFTPRGGIGIRGYKHGFCPPATAPCPAPDYWAIRLPQVLATVHPDAIVVNLGINDTATRGTDDGAGYANYSAKMTWLLSLLPPGVPVFWSGLPTPIEPPARRAGCAAIDQAITKQTGITVLHWYAVAYQHPGYMLPHTNVHYTQAGDDAYAAMVVSALDSYFGA
jgi:hypothetical protein